MVTRGALTIDMSLVFLIVDAPVSTVGVNGVGTPLLTLPLGRRTLLAQLARRAQRMADGEVGELLILRDFPATRDDARLADDAGVKLRVINSAELRDVLGALPDSDDLVVFDAARWPADDIDPAGLLREYRQGHGAMHAIGVGTRTGRAQERVERDEKGQVTRVQRDYGMSTAPEVAAHGAFLSILPVGCVQGVSFDSLAGLCSVLKDYEVDVREFSVPVNVLNLRTVDGVLALTDRSLSHEQGGVRVRDVTDKNFVIAGAESYVDPSARVIGPVILHDRVQVARGATIVGPAVVGRDAQIGPDAVVAQAVVASGARVAKGVTLRHCVAVGECTESSSTMQERPAPARLTGAVTPQAPRISRRIQFAIKRTIDILVAGTSLLVMSPILIVVGILVKLTSRGPLFFIHHRERADGKEFGCIKFRTMADGAHKMQEELQACNEVDGPQFKLRHDPRVTRLGAWMRKTNIDEFPQLINVLLGHMSLVGPRPSPFRENQICVPWRRARLSVRPGITGLWQICRSADRSAGDFHEWIFYDMAYVRNFSLWLDVKILVATLITLGGRNSVPIKRLLPNCPTEVSDPSA